MLPARGASRLLAAIVHGQLEPSIIVVEVSREIAVRVALAVVAEEMVEAFFIGLPEVWNIPMPHLPMHAVA